MRAHLLHFSKIDFFARLDYGQARHQFEYFRVFIALFSLFSFASFLIDYNVFLVPKSIISWEVTNANAYWFEPHFLKIARLLKINEITLLFICSFGYIAALVSLLLGYFTRIASLLSFAFFLLFSVQLYPFLYGVDLYQSVFLMMLCVFPSGFSMSRASKTTSDVIEQQQRIGVRGIQAYLALTYFSAGFGKMKMGSWLNGKFLFLSLSDPNYSMVHFPQSLDSHFYVISGLIVIISETAYFAFMLIPYVRTLVLFAIVGMHLFIGIFMGLVPFGLLLAGVNSIIWYPLVLEDISRVSRLKKQYSYAV